jgi:hypothetical protein
MVPAYQPSPVTLRARCGCLVRGSCGYRAARAKPIRLGPRFTCSWVAVCGRRHPAEARRSPFSVALSAISPALSDEFGETDAVFSGDHLGCFFANHDRGRVGVAADYRRHDAGIRYP